MHSCGFRPRRQFHDRLEGAAAESVEAEFQGSGEGTWPRTQVGGEVKIGDPLKLKDPRVGGSIPSLATT
jgi:hypothetical protein